MNKLLIILLIMTKPIYCNIDYIISDLNLIMKENLVKINSENLSEKQKNYISGINEGIFISLELIQQQEQR